MELKCVDAPRSLRPSPDEHWAIPGKGRVSLWWKNPPCYGQEKAGTIGHFEAEDPETAKIFLDKACERLGEEGCTVAIGPFDGSTYFRYRLLTERSDDPRFRLEPDNPDTWPHFFQSAGFETIATYHSALNVELDYRDPRRERVEERLKGLTIRTIRTEDAEESCRRIYRLSLQVFRNNFLYVPVDEEDYLSLYRPILPLVRPELVFFAQDGDRDVGFFFVLPDTRPDTYIMKSFAVLPERKYAGLGNLLVWRCREKAIQLGYTREIHALMGDSNASAVISARTSRVIRRYALYARKL